jgi:hypothetical protein
MLQGSTMHADPGAGSSVRRETRSAGTQCRFAAAVLFVVLALLAFHSARLGTSSLFAQIAELEMGRWSASALIGDARAVARAEQFLSNSLWYAPGNSWALEQFGALSLAKMRASTVPREAVAVTGAARAGFRRALEQRPTAPFLWVNLALTKLYLDEIDAEFRAALGAAIELGPWEPLVQQTALFVGLATWPDLDAGLREQLLATLERGALRDAEKMTQIVKSYRRFDLICGIKAYNSSVNRTCPKRSECCDSADVKQRSRR